MSNATGDGELAAVRAQLHRAEQELSVALRRVERLRNAEAVLAAMADATGETQDAWALADGARRLADDDLEGRVARVIMDLAAGLAARDQSRPRTSEGVRQIIMESAGPIKTSQIVAEFAKRGWLDRQSTAPRAAIHQAAVRLAQADAEIRRVGPGAFEAVSKASTTADE